MRRFILEPLLVALQQKKIVLLTGFPGTGKTHIIKEVISSLEQKNTIFFLYKLKRQKREHRFKTPKIFNHIFLENTLDPELLNIKKAKKKIYIIFDNVHELYDPIGFIWGVYDGLQKKLPRNIELHIFSTSAVRLPEHGREARATAMARLFMYPYSWPECWYQFQRSKEKHFFYVRDYKKAATYFQKNRQHMSEVFSLFLRNGGFPAVWNVAQPATNEAFTDVLQDIIRTYLDSVAAKHFVQHELPPYVALMEFLAEHTGLSMKKKEMVAKMGIFPAELPRYTALVEQTLLFSFCEPFYTDTRYETSKRNKVYAIDQLFIDYPNKQMHILEESYNKERAIENFVYTELIKECRFDEIRYYRTTTKMDLPFIGIRGDILIPFDFSFSSSQPEVRSVLRLFLKRYKKSVPYGVVLTRDTFAMKDNIFFVPLVMFPFFRFDATV